MAITKILLDEEKGEISVERAVKEFESAGMRQVEPTGDKGWLVATLLQKQMVELLSLPLPELQKRHLKQMRE